MNIEKREEVLWKECFQKCNLDVASDGYCSIFVVGLDEEM